MGILQITKRLKLYNLLGNNDAENKNQELNQSKKAKGY